MTVKAIRLQNFMAFEDTGWIELGPICLLFGHNSVGKSTIIRALRLLKQSLATSSGSGPLVFFAEHGLDQGTFPTTIHRQDTSRSMIFSFRCELVRTLDRVRDSLNRQRTIHGQPPILRDAPETWAELKLAFSWKEETKSVDLEEVTVDCPWTVVDTEERRTVFGASRLDQEAAGVLGSDWWFWSDILQGHELDDIPNAR